MAAWKWLLDRVPSKDWHRPASFAFSDCFVDAAGEIDESLDQGTPLYAYRIGKAGVHIHFFDYRIGSSGERCNLCIVAERFVGGRHLAPGDIDVGLDSYPRQIDSAGDGRKSPVLIKIRESRQDRKWIESGMRNCALIRLSLLDECPYRFWKSSDHWATFYLELARIGKDRELGFPSAFRSCIDSVIEGGTERLDRLASHEGPVWGRRLILDCEDSVLDLLRRSDIALYPWGVGIRVLEGTGFPAQCLYAFYAPAELELRRCLAHEVPSR